MFFFCYICIISNVTRVVADVVRYESGPASPVVKLIQDSAMSVDTAGKSDRVLSTSEVDPRGEDTKQSGRMVGDGRSSRHDGNCTFSVVKKVADTPCFEVDESRTMPTDEGDFYLIVLAYNNNNNNLLLRCVECSGY